MPTVFGGMLSAVHNRGAQAVGHGTGTADWPEVGVSTAASRQPKVSREVWDSSGANRPRDSDPVALRYASRLTSACTTSVSSPPSKLRSHCG